MKPASRSSAAFTLAELMVVVSIIAILLPALNKAKQAAVRVQCNANQRQVVVALHDYTLDFRGKFPTRNPKVSYGYPHQMRRVNNGPYDLAEPFINPYLGTS